MSKIFLIIGKSFSGKDYLLNEILKDKDFCENNNLEKLVLYTTRPKRDGEVEGKDYYFIDSFTPNEQLVVNAYETVYGTWHYITDFSKLDDNKNYILAGNPEMIERYKKIIGKNNLCIIYLIPPNWKIFERFSKRTDYGEERYKEIYRRFIDDLTKFGFKSNEYLANVASIINVGSKLNLSGIKDNMEFFICGDTDSIILNKNGNLIFENEYPPVSAMCYTSVLIDNNHQEVLDGIISIYNGRIKINSEDESFDTFQLLYKKP